MAGDARTKLHDMDAAGFAAIGDTYAAGASTVITRQRLAKAAVKQLSRTRLRLLSTLGARRMSHCPACDQKVVGFFRYGDCTEWGCPACGSSPRERLMNHLLDTGRIAIPANAAVLHVAPSEVSLRRRFASQAGRYRPADFDPGRYDVPGIEQLDLMRFDEPGAYDIVYASHVMEHVPGDAVVLRALFAGLKPGGEAWLIVPLHDGPSVDGGDGLSPSERERRFGQWDHMRQYGPDFAERIARAGFEVKVFAASGLPAETQLRLGLGDTVFVGRRP